MWGMMRMSKDVARLDSLDLELIELMKAEVEKGGGYFSPPGDGLNPVDALGWVVDRLPSLDEPASKSVVADVIWEEFLWLRKGKKK